MLKPITLDLTPFERYRPLIDDWAAFADISQQPLPTWIWANPLRVSGPRLAELLAAEGTPYEPLPWYPGGFKLAPDFRPGHHWGFLSGLFHAQEAVSMLPVLFLDPQPGERVLDLCAAPGNKSAQIAIRLGNRGTVIANDINFIRMRAVRQTVQRLGLLNVSTTVWDASNYPKRAGLFDRILVDAPCSCEGTLRKNPGVLQQCGPAISKQRGRGQQTMLRQAVRRCKPGGRIVYSTCTYAPEENELVVDAILGEFGPSILRLAPARLPGLISQPGLTKWDGMRLDPSLNQALRIWPHHNDTGGFFIAVLEKLAPTGPGEDRLAGATAVDPATSITPTDLGAKPAPAVVWEVLAERFGIPAEVLTEYTFFQPNRERVFIVASDHQPPPPTLVDVSGISFMKTRIRYPKLSTGSAQIFGHYANRNFVELDAEQTWKYLNRQFFYVSDSQCTACTDMGYVLCRYQGFDLGVGLFHPKENGKGAVIRSLYPKGWSPTKGPISSFDENWEPAF